MPKFIIPKLIIAALISLFFVNRLLAAPLSVDNQDIDPEAARDQILNGVTSLADPSGPGYMVVYGPTAYSIANYKDASLSDPMIAAAGFGAGKVIALPDHQWLEMDSYANTGTTGQFYLNSITWLSGATDKSIKIVVTPNTSARTWLLAQGFTNVVQSGNYSTELSDADLLIGWLGPSVAQTDLDAIASFVRNGGGLFIADYGIGYSWWWNKALPDVPSNILLREVGIAFLDNWPHGGESIDPANRAVGQFSIDNIRAMINQPALQNAADLATGIAILNAMDSVLPPGDTTLAQVDQDLLAQVATINPTPLTPVSDPVAQQLLLRESTILNKTPIDQVTAHRTVEAVYGAVPADAPRVTQAVTLDTSKGAWLATGLYAAPGEVVTFTFPSELVGKGYRMRINAHTDNISRRASWERMPVVHRTYAIDQSPLRLASAFGGLLFFDGGGTPLGLGAVTVTVAGAVEAPFFVLGQHSDQQWVETLRQRPAPYAVMVSDHMQIVFRSVEAANLTEPTALMQWWNQAVADQDDLVGAVTNRTNPELLNIDVQISAGSGHSGYPFQGYDVYWGNPADWERLRNHGSWGDFHELGHNHQRGWWTFDGDGEVSVNIMSNYNLESLTTNPSGSGWGWSADPTHVMEHAIEDVAPGGSYSSKPNRWSFWFQLADGFGWETYRTVFHGYEADNLNNKSALPTNNQEEKDQWLVRWSQAVGYDMTRFMRDTWGLEVSQSAVDQVSALPDWMPLASRVQGFTIWPSSTYTVDIAGGALSMDGVATLIAVGQPTHGSLVELGSGVYSYTAGIDYVGSDPFTFTLQSSAGNTQIFTASVTITDSGVLMESWFNIGGGMIKDFTSTVNYPASPNERVIIANMDAPQNRTNNFGVRMRSYLVPPADGQYTFWIASDDEGELWLSSDSNPANVQRIAQAPTWTDPYQWDKFPEQQSITITLVAGERYYIEALMKEGGGGDHLSIAWQGPGIEQQVIPASAFSLTPVKIIRRTEENIFLPLVAR